MVPLLFYAACAVASAGLLLLLMAKAGTGEHGRAKRVAASLIGLAGIAWILVLIVQAIPVPDNSLGQLGLILLCSFISIAAAVRVITHHRPVFCALYFVLVVLSGAATFVLLSAEFVAFALVIVYAGAILITYLFVLMLAQQTPADLNGSDAVNYDSIPREPASAVIAGFVLVAVLGGAVFGADRSPARATIDQARAIEGAWYDLAWMPRTLTEQARRVDPTVIAIVPEANGHLLRVQPDHSALVRVQHSDGRPASTITLPPSLLPDNTSRVGMALVTRFPVSLELAGVILLMAMLGAVVLARRTVESTTTTASRESNA